MLKPRSLLSALPIPAAWHGALAQLARYGATGGFITVLAIAVYYGCAQGLKIHPLLANGCAYLVAMVIGQWLHSRFSFHGHGSREQPVRQSLKGFAVSLLSFGLNSLFVWLLTGVLNGPNWWPIPAMVFVTPLVCFVAYRKWVFT